jgi:hypothetical protein
MANQIIAVLDHRGLEETLAAEGHAELLKQSWQKPVQTVLRHYHWHAAERKKLAYV